MIVKRLFDLTVAVLGLILIWPLLLMVAILIKATSPGPILFAQRRVGQHGREFEILKFRTMVPNAASLGPLVTATGDPRITPVGRVLRKYKLDELPQLWNVLVGQMSLVGPRPEVAKYVALYPTEAKRVVLSIKPGITDWAAIRFRHEEDILGAATDREQAYVEEILPIKIRIYMEYVHSRSLLMDLRILASTLLVVLNRR